MTHDEEPGLPFRSPVWFGTVAGILSFLICWLMNGPNEFEYLHRKVAHQLHRWDKVALEFYEERQRMPDSIDELLHDATPYSEKAVLDYWQQSIQYIPHPRNPEFVSFGRDGKAGGVGVDADISSQDYLPGGWPTLWQFAFCFGPKFFLVAIGIGIIGSRFYVREVTTQRQSGCDSIRYTRLVFLLVITSLLTGVACAVVKIDKGKMLSAMWLMPFPTFPPIPIQSSSE